MEPYLHRPLSGAAARRQSRRRLPPAGLLSPPPHPRVAAFRGPGRPACQPRPGLQKAWEARDITALIGLLDPGVTATAGTGGLANSIAQGPIEGAEQVARAALDVAGRAPGPTLPERTANGQPGPVAQQDGVTAAVFAFDVAGDQIKHIWAVPNPEKLRPWTTG